MSSVSEWFGSLYEALVRNSAGGGWRDFVPLGIAGLLVWGLWIYRVVLSRLDKPVVNDYRTTVSVVIPSYREDAAILVRCLDSWLAQDPMEVIIVVDVADTDCHERLNEARDPRLKVLIYEHSGKRSALGVGIREAQGEVVVFADSDTWWEPGLLDAVQMPFQDPAVGGVGTQQNVYQRTTSVWRRIADWLVNLRYRGAGQCSGLQAGGEGPRGRAAGPERAVRRSVLLLDVPAAAR